MGTPEFAVPILNTLMELTDVILVVTKPDGYIGRKKVLTPSPIKKVAISNNIPVFQPEKIKINYEEICKYNPDLIVTCAYGQIIPREILDLPRLGCINIHASLLPKYRGGAPIQTAIINGDKETGITIMYMDVGMDTGDIIEQKAIPILDDDTCESMHNKLSLLGSSLLKQVLPTIIEGTNKREKQNSEEATYAPIITRQMEHLDFSKKASEVNNKVRGLNSWPLANFILNDEECKVINGYIGGANKGSDNGLIVEIKKDAIGISCCDKIYYITKIKPFGKKAMDVKDYLNGIDKEKILNKKVK